MNPTTALELARHQQDRVAADLASHRLRISTARPPSRSPARPRLHIRPTTEPARA